MPALAAKNESQPYHPELVEGSRRAAFQRLKERLSAKPPALAVERLIPTGIPKVDELLDGGFPAGTVATLEGDTGRWSLAAGFVARMTRCSLVAIIDDGGLYPPTLVEAGAHLERVLVVPVLRFRSEPAKALAMARAADILLRSRICRLVLMPFVTLRDAVWERLSKLAHRSGALLIVIAARAGTALSAAAEVRLHCRLERIHLLGRHGLWGAVDGFELSLGVRKHRHRAAGRTALVTVGHAALN